MVHNDFIRFCVAKLASACFHPVNQTGFLGVFAEIWHRIRKVRRSFQVLPESVVVKPDFFQAAFRGIPNCENTAAHIFSLDMLVCGAVLTCKGFEQTPLHTAVATHIHWDHIGGHKYFSDFYAHEAELNWLNGEFPLNMDTIREMVVDRCDLPDGYVVSSYEFFQGTPTRVLHDGDCIDLGGRTITVFHTPGHSPGHMCFLERKTGYLFTGDLVYKDTLFAYYSSTDPQAYLKSLETIALLPVRRVFPAHHTLDIQPEILFRMRDAFRQLDIEGKLHHGSGTFDYGDWAVWL